MSLQEITVNLNGGLVRNDSMDGQDYMVVPCVMLIEGVHNGSHGPGFYPATELKKYPYAWNMKPIVINHPMENGRGITACSPNIISTRGVGLIMNTKFAKGSKKEPAKLPAEAWFNEAKLLERAPEIHAAIKAGKTVELSTGLATDDELIPGEWNGVKYNAVMRNYRPDHLALMTDGRKGACSNEDGCGLLRNEEAGETDLTDSQVTTPAVPAEQSTLILNEMSHEKMRSGCQQKYYNGPNGESSGYVKDTYNNFHIYENPKDGKMYKQNHSMAASGDIQFDGKPEEVKKHEEYRNMDGGFVANIETPAPVTKGESVMDKTKAVDHLIANAAGWKEIDRPLLLNFSDEKLKELVDANPAKATPVLKTNEKPCGCTETTTNTQVQPALVTLEQLPPEIVAVYEHGRRALQAEREQSYAVINQGGEVYTKEYLDTRNPDELKGLVILAQRNQPQRQVTAPVPHYLGQGGGSPILVNSAPRPAGKVTPLATPMVMNSAKKELSTANTK